MSIYVCLYIKGNGKIYLSDVNFLLFVQDY